MATKKTLKFAHKFKDGLIVVMTARLGKKLKVICTPPIFTDDNDYTPERVAEYNVWRFHVAREIERAMGLDKICSHEP